MLTILNVIVPVFAIVALGYSAVRWKLYPAAGVHGLVAFVNNFATPILLFRAMSSADFSTAFNPAIIGPFYVGAIVSLVVGAFLARRFFGARPGESISSGFSAMFTNTVLIGLPLLHRAYGDQAMPVVYSIIGLHAPTLITLAMLVMELTRRDGGNVATALAQALPRILRNPLLIGIACGLAFNFLGFSQPEPLDAFTSMMAQAVLPAALFGLGGALNEYRLADSWAQAAAMSGLKLLIHPAIAWVLMVPILHVDPHMARYGVLLAAMPSGINTYVFATYYHRAVDVATNTILITTVGSVLSVSLWLYLLSL